MKLSDTSEISELTLLLLLLLYSPIQYVCVNIYFRFRILQIISYTTHTIHSGIHSIYWLNPNAVWVRKTSQRKRKFIALFQQMIYEVIWKAPQCISIYLCFRYQHYSHSTTSENFIASICIQIYHNPSTHLYLLCQLRGIFSVKIFLQVEWSVKNSIKSNGKKYIKK